MTEQEYWLCQSPDLLLNHLVDNNFPHLTRRKLALYVTAISSLAKNRLPSAFTDWAEEDFDSTPFHSALDIVKTWCCFSPERAHLFRKTFASPCRPCWPGLTYLACPCNHWHTHTFCTSYKCPKCRLPASTLVAANISRQAQQIALAAYHHRLPDHFQIDPLSLHALADCLEEDGSPPLTPCPMCHNSPKQGLLRAPTPTVPAGWITCHHCHGKGLIPNPLLAHLRTKDPVFPGNLALDAVLSKA
jgi:hypothetical protein